MSFKKVNLSENWVVDSEQFTTFGIHSTPIIVNNGNKKFVLKQSSLGKKLSKEESKLMVWGVKKHYLELKKSEFNLPKIDIITPIKDYTIKGNYYFVASLEEFINKKNIVETLIESNNKKQKILFEKLLIETYKVSKIKGKNNLFTGLPIDSKPQNFVLGNNNKLYFVDFYAPKTLDENGDLFPFFKHLHNGRTYEYLLSRFTDKRSIFHILLAECISVCPKQRTNFEKIVFDFLNKKNEKELINYLKFTINQNYSNTEFISKENLIKIKNS